MEEKEKKMIENIFKKRFSFENIVKSKKNQEIVFKPITQNNSGQYFEMILKDEN